MKHRVEYRPLAGAHTPARSLSGPVEQSSLPVQGKDQPVADLSKKVIITCAVTGGIHTPTMSDALPFTPDDIARQSIEAAEAGASILHLHARDPKDGRPTPDPAVFMQFLPRIKQATDAVINVTTGGGLNMSVEQRLAAPLLAKPAVGRRHHRFGRRGSSCISKHEKSFQAAHGAATR